ncbi:MAG: hypothetical protein V3U19_00955 [Thermodesulfobacteriota bacterium]
MRGCFFLGISTTLLGFSALDLFEYLVGALGVTLSFELAVL